MEQVPAHHSVMFYSGCSSSAAGRESRQQLHCLPSDATISVIIKWCSLSFFLALVTALPTDYYKRWPQGQFVPECAKFQSTPSVIKLVKLWRFRLPIHSPDPPSWGPWAVQQPGARVRPPPGSPGPWATGSSSSWWPGPQACPAPAGHN